MHFACMLELTEKEIEKIKKEFPLWVGNRIKIVRNDLGITQTKLAELTGKDRQYIYKIEKGVVTPNISTIKIISEALKISLSDLFNYDT